MNRHISILIIYLASISAIFAENTSRQTDSLKILLQTSQNDTNRVKILTELSAYLIMADKYDSAIVCASEALSISEAIDYQSGIASAYRKLGVASIQQGRFPQALEFLLQSMRINEILNNMDEIFKLNNNIGNLYYSQGNYEYALKYFGRAYVYDKNNAFTNSNIGITYMAQEDYKKSLAFLERALVLYSKNGDKNGMANTICNIGYINEHMGSYQQALEYYSQALQIKKDIGDMQGMVDARASRGDVLYRQKKIKDAIAEEIAALTLALQIGYMTSAQETYKKLSEIYESVGQKDSAYNNFKKHILLRDSLFNEKTVKNTTRSEMNFEFDKKRAVDIALHSSEIKYQQILRNIFILAFFMILVFFAFLFRGFKKMKRQKLIIEAQKKIMEEHQLEISDNLNYAAKLQRAMLPSQEYINGNFSDNMVIFFPRDVVSGDFFYNYVDEKSIYFGVADATGHGISGSLTASLANSLLNEVIVERKIESPEIILTTLRSEIIKSLNQIGSGEERKDGIDISLVKITGMKLECACANNSIYIIRDKNLTELKADRFPCGKYITEFPFTLKTFDLEKGDIIITFSDGMSDQFGGPKGKKLMSKQLKSWLVDLSTLEMAQMKSELERKFNEWKGLSGNQTDDVTVFAVRI